MNTNGLQARDHAMSSRLLMEYSLMAFVLHQDHPDCAMLSSAPLPAQGQAAPSPGTHGMTKCSPEPLVQYALKEGKSNQPSFSYTLL